MHNGKKSARGWARVARTLLSLRVQRSNPVSNARTRMRATLLFTGSPRSRCSLAMTRDNNDAAPLTWGAVLLG